MKYIKTTLEELVLKWKYWSLVLEPLCMKAKVCAAVINSLSYKGKKGCSCWGNMRSPFIPDYFFFLLWQGVMGFCSICIQKKYFQWRTEKKVIFSFSFHSQCWNYSLFHLWYIGFRSRRVFKILHLTANKVLVIQRNRNTCYFCNNIFLLSIYFNFHLSHIYVFI